MKIPRLVNKIKFNNLSTASQLSLLAIVILVGAVFFTVNSALQEPTNTASHASVAGITSDHTYRIESQCNTTLFADVSANSMDNSVPIILWGWSSSWNKDREWIVKDLGNGYYSIRALSSLKYMNVKGNSIAAGAAIIQYSNTSSPVVNEQWKIIKLENGKYEIVGKHSAMAIAPSACPITQGAHLYQYKYDGSKRMQWEFEDMTTRPTPTPTKKPTPTPTKSPGLTCTPRPPCLDAIPRCMIMEPAWGWCPPGPTVPPTPTVTPTEVPSTSPSPSEVPSPTSAPSTSPSPSAAQGTTFVNLSISLHGIGSGGDSANPNSQGNQNPLRGARPVTVDVYDVQNQLVVSQNGAVHYDHTSGKFTGLINLGNSFTTGLYTVKVKADQYLRAQVPGIQTITSGKTNTLPLATLIAGDINNDNAINIEDYNILIGCYSDLLPATDCTTDNNALADLTDDGHVNQFDYNLFLRELTNIGGQ